MGAVITHGHVVLQILKNKYDMGYLQPSWLGRKWQPWYQDLLDLAGIKGRLHLAFVHLPPVFHVKPLVLAVQACGNTHAQPRRHVLLRFDARHRVQCQHVMCMFSLCIV